MIDRLREQLQERLDQLLGEADRLRKALAALDPRPKPPARTPAARKPARDDPAQAGRLLADGVRSRPGGRPSPATRLPSPDGAGRDPRRGARGARRRRGDDRRRGRGQGRARPPDRVDHADEARQERRGAEGRARLPARARPDRDTGRARRVASLAARRWTADLRRRTLPGDGTPAKLHLPALQGGADLRQHQRNRERQPAPGRTPRQERRARPDARARRVLALALEVARPRLRRPTRSAIAARVREPSPRPPARTPGSAAPRRTPRCSRAHPRRTLVAGRRRARPRTGA